MSAVQRRPGTGWRTPSPRPGTTLTYLIESLRVATIDQLVHDLDEARMGLGLSKAELARSISAEPAVIRRLLSPGHRNPTIGTVAEVAAALGLRVALVPMSDGERERAAAPLRSGAAKYLEKLARTFASTQASSPTRERSQRA